MRLFVWKFYKIWNLKTITIFVPLKSFYANNGDSHPNPKNVPFLWVLKIYSFFYYQKCIECQSITGILHLHPHCGSSKVPSSPMDIRNYYQHLNCSSASIHQNFKYLVLNFPSRYSLQNLMLIWCSLREVGDVRNTYNGRINKEEEKNKMKKWRQHRGCRARE